MPFVISTFLVLPSLLITAITKGSSGYEAIRIGGLLELLMAVLSVFVVVSTVSGALYLWRGKGWLSKLMVLFLLLVVLSSYLYCIK